MQICLVYDCLYPNTVGGAERWYRSLAERLAADGHEVTYLTLRQWDRGSDAGVEGVDVRVVGPRKALYTQSGRRRILPPLVFGVGVLLFLLRHGRRFDAVHTASFPYFSLLAAALARRRGGYRLVVDWHEVWSREYWREYLGEPSGLIGWWVQLLCARVPQRAFCFSRLHAGRLQELGLRGEVTVLSGEYDGSVSPPAEPIAPEQLVVFAGRMIPEKRAGAVVEAVAAHGCAYLSYGRRSSAMGPSATPSCARSPSSASRAWWTCPASSHPTRYKRNSPTRCVCFYHHVARVTGLW